MRRREEREVKERLRQWGGWLEVVELVGEEEAEGEGR
jgi:hypothetical protein